MENVILCTSVQGKHYFGMFSLFSFRIRLKFTLLNCFQLRAIYSYPSILVSMIFLFLVTAGTYLVVHKDK